MSTNPILAMRTAVGLTQVEFARSVETSQSAIAAYEGGAKSPTFRTLERFASKLALVLDLDTTPALTRDERRSLAYHRAIAKKLREHPGACVAHAKKNLHKLKRLNPGGANTWQRWEAWLALPADDLEMRILQKDTIARELRHASPFMGMLGAAERTRILTQFRQEEAA
jgi:transcriptional regulator with XRE-family HTH domain